MIGATVDTNVLASGFVSSQPGRAPGDLVDAWRAGAFTLFASEYLLTELAHTFHKPYFRGRLTAEQIERALFLVRRDATLVTTTVHVAGVATHAEDDLILATAVSAGADYLVTGDRRFRTRVPAYQGVRLVTPREFVGILQAQRSNG